MKLISAMEFVMEVTITCLASMMEEIAVNLLFMFINVRWTVLAIAIIGCLEDFHILLNHSAMTLSQVIFHLNLVLTQFQI